ncbi:MAG: hypothetical protein A3J66_04210 [Candidatus Magasanikbacteria bacterium RIFCSPHIGHO2_02_FULL_47_14]|uniref:NTP pyrophosphohydrolase MazG-like domain-containing protein n=1 Tax=Candidatus Magasanikbacteria bacterium RIFCSPHIGHO2_02_FULL_47_14 TaxID=1798680 RepID=A0A1F6M3P3_9BACT|nr:MAG: hypothetical protein A3J66_04210 [Candidatus Magasanikbacteria bacterium RIFCSPHIGHO2_02_FULL_47_14]
MTFEEYQQHTGRQLISEDLHSLEYYALGLTGEAGEVADKIKKIWRDHNRVVSDEDKEKLKQELGDVMWYVSQMASFLGFSLHEVASGNIAKGDDRHARGVQHGAGDDR